MPYIKHLPYCALFAGLNEEEVEAFRPACQYSTYQAGSLLMEEGVPGDTVIILLEGEVVISKALTLAQEGEESGNRDKTFIRLSGKDKPFFGEMSLLLPEAKRNATVKAVTDCKVITVEKAPFLEICKQNPKLGFQVMWNIARKLARDLQRENLNVLKLTTAFSLILEE